jgi:general stress protein CsbA
VGGTTLARLATGGLVVAGIINLLPLSGVLGRSWLLSLYGQEIGSVDMEILLRHRAVLFGIVAVVLFASIRLTHWRGAAILVAGLSMASFIIVAMFVGGYGPLLRTVVIVDVIGLLALIPPAIHLLISRS